MVQYLNASLPDHSPLLLEIVKEDKGGRRPFKLFPHLVHHPSFLEIIGNDWSVLKPHSLKQVWNSLKVIKTKLKALHVGEFGDVRDRIAQSRDELAKCQDVLQQDLWNSEVLELEREARIQRRKWLRIHNSIMQQKARIKWIKDGDSDSQFFHASVKARTAGNIIVKLIDENGQVLSGMQEIEAEVLKFYKELLGESNAVLEGIDVGIVRAGRILNHIQR